MLKPISAWSIKRLLIFFIVTLLCNNQTVTPIDVAQLKDTYSILADEFKHCSPVFGAVWIETQLIKKYYKYFAQDTLNKPKYSTIKLIRMLFHLIGDSFSITRDLSMPAHYFSPKLIGLIIGTLEKTTIADKKELPKIIEMLINNDAGFMGQVNANLNQGTSVENQLRIIKDRVTQISKAIAISLDECGFWDRSGKNQLYPHYTTHAVLLGFLYKLSNNKKDLREFFQALNATISKEIFTTAGKNIFAQAAWDVSYFDKNSADAIINICAAKSTIPASANMPTQFLQEVGKQLAGKDPFEAIVFAEITKQFYSRSLPQIIPNRRNDISFQGRPFSDCTEIVMRNLCNFVVFNQETLKFIPIKSGNINPCPELINYYQGDAADATKHLTSSMYQTWGNFMQNIPGYIYAAMASLYSAERYERHIIGNTIFKSHLAQPCYVLLSQEDINKLPVTIHGNFNRLNVGSEPYVVADLTKYKTYALWPSLKNIIILLNRFFGLELYKDDPLAPFKDINFCSKYFPAVCQKLGWEFTNPGINLDMPYFSWNATIPMRLAKDPNVSWNLFVKWHHVEIQNLKTPPLSLISKKYKETLFNGLMGSQESMNLYGLLALYVPQNPEQMDRAINNLLHDDTVKNRFIMYLQNLEDVINDLESRKAAPLPNDARIESALTLAMGDSEVVKTKAIKTPVAKTKKLKNDLQVKLHRVRTALHRLQSSLSLLKTKLKDLASALKTPEP